MRWHSDNDDGQWTATVTPEGRVRILRLVVKAPYREDQEPRLEYESFELLAREASDFGGTLRDAAAVALSAPQ